MIWAICSNKIPLSQEFRTDYLGLSYQILCRHRWVICSETIDESCLDRLYSPRNSFQVQKPPCRIFSCGKSGWNWYIFFGIWVVKCVTLLLQV